MSTEKSELILPAVKKQPNYQPPAAADDSQVVMRIIERALTSPDFNIERVQQLLDLKERYDKIEAKKAYIDAMSAFKKEGVEFFKTKKVDYGPGKAKFDYAPIAEVVAKITPALAAHGLSHRWASKVVDGKVIVRCIMTHRLGHSEEEEAPAVAPGQNPAMSPSQNLQGTITYWQRMTLQAITGTAASDMPDLDSHHEDAEPETIGEGQIADILALLTETNTSLESFLRVIKVKAIEDIHVASYPMVVGLLESKRHKAK